MANPVYDVAFSFVEEDEHLAGEINELLRDRLTTFVSSRNQRELAGRDGEAEWRRVFGEAAAVVVILYREQWGQDAWTRFEETAIRERGRRQGHDFVLLVPLNYPPLSPDWVPKRNLCHHYERFGARGVAVAIREKLLELGTTPVESSIAKGLRLARELEANNRRRDDRVSAEYGAIGTGEVNALCSILKNRINSRSPDDHAPTITLIPDPAEMLIVLRPHTLGLWWTAVAAHPDGEGHFRFVPGLHIGLWRGIYRPSGFSLAGQEPELIVDAEYVLNAYQMEKTWAFNETEWINHHSLNVSTTRQLADYWLAALFKAKCGMIEKEELRSGRCQFQTPSIMIKMKVEKQW